MLTLKPALRRRSGRGKFGIALAGGDSLGAFYERGALHAVQAAIEIDLVERMSEAIAQ